MILEMSPAQVSEMDFVSYEISDTITGTGYGNTWIVHPSIKVLSVILKIISGSAKVQYSCDKLSNIKDNTASWEDWFLGTVNSTANDKCSPVTALRAYCASGSCYFQVRGQ